MSNVVPEVAIPDHWQSVEMKWLLRFGNGSDYKAVEDDAGRFPVYGSGGEFARASDFLYDGESVLFGRKGTVDRPLHVRGKFWTVDTMYFTRLGPRVNGRFVYYFATTIPYGLLSTSTALPSMTQSTLGSVRMPLPPITEQCAIACFLDRETAEIDAMVDAQGRLVAHLEERRSVLVTEVATSGVGGERASVESGHEWIGRVPDDWSLVPLGRVFSERKQIVSDRNFQPLSVTKDGIVPQLDTAAKTDNGDNRKKVCIDDFVINSRSDRKGSSGTSQLEGSVSVISTVLTPRGIDPGYAHHLLRSSAFQEEFYRFGTGIVADLWSTRYSAMRKITVPLPPVQEQREIAAFLDAATQQIDLMITKARMSISLMKERRAALISAAVTGRIDPRTGVDRVRGRELEGAVG